MTLVTGQGNRRRLNESLLHVMALDALFNFKNSSKKLFFLFTHKETDTEKSSYFQAFPVTVQD